MQPAIAPVMSKSNHTRSTGNKYIEPTMMQAPLYKRILRAIGSRDRGAVERGRFETQRLRRAGASRLDGDGDAR